jgi:hypothetical protein
MGKKRTSKMSLVAKTLKMHDALTGREIPKV